MNDVKVKTPKDWFIDNEVEIGDYLKLEFDSVLLSKQYHHYLNNIKSETGAAIYNAYGDYTNNRLYLTLDYKNKIYYSRVDSDVVGSKMIDRIFCNEIKDIQSLSFLGDILCFIYIENRTLQEWLDKAEK